MFHKSSKFLSPTAASHWNQHRQMLLAQDALLCRHYGMVFEQFNQLLFGTWPYADQATPGWPLELPVLALIIRRVSMAQSAQAAQSCEKQSA